MKSENIVLIGFMGVGKGTTARALAKELDILCVDTDDLLESIEKKQIKQIFKQKGEEHFRKLEQNLAKNLQKSLKRTIISTGGGFFAVSNLNKIGKVIYLKSSFDGILSRLKNSKNPEKKLNKRPLFKDEQKAKELFNKREKQYAQKANITIKTEDKTTKQIVCEIIEKLNKI